MDSRPQPRPIKSGSLGSGRSISSTFARCFQCAARAGNHGAEGTPSGLDPTFTLTFPSICDSLSHPFDYNWHRLPHETYSTTPALLEWKHLSFQAASCTMTCRIYNLEPRQSLAGLARGLPEHVSNPLLSEGRCNRLYTPFWLFS